MKYLEIDKDEIKDGKQETEEVTPKAKQDKSFDDYCSEYEI